MALSESLGARPSGWEIANRAWRSTAEAVNRMPPLFISAWVLLLAVQLLGLAMINRQMLSMVPRWVFFLEALVQYVLSAAIAAPVAVAVHRWVLLKDVQPGIISWKAPYTRLFFLWVLALRLAYFVTTLPSLGRTADVATVAPRPGGGMVVLAGIVSLVVVIASVYLAMIFPDVAIGEPSTSWRARIEKSVDRVQGNFWLLVRAIILAFLPVIIAQILIILLVGRSWGFSMFTMQLFGLRFILQSVLSAVVTVLGIGVAAATVSWLYSWVRSARVEG